MSIFKGSGVAIVTPFNENGIDYKKLKELLDMGIITQEEFDLKKKDLLDL